MQTENQLIREIITYMPADTTPAVQRDAERLLSAAFAVAHDPEIASPAVRQLLEAIRTPYGCWIGEVQRAFYAGRDEFPDGAEISFWPVMRGALFMATVWLEDMHRANGWQPATIPTGPKPPAPALS